MDAKLDGLTWTDITADTLADEALTIDYGIDGIGPLDVLAGTGLCAFALQNWNPVGKYSPGHANCTAGWKLGVWIRCVFVPDLGPDLVKFIGKVQFLDVRPGTYGPKRVHVIAHDGMGDLAQAEVRNVQVQIDQPDVALVAAVYAALPASAQPVATDFDTTVESYPYAFADVSAGQQAGNLLTQILVSGMSLLVQLGNGTHRWISRHTRRYAASVDSFTAADFLAPDGLEHPHDLLTTYNRIVVEIPQIDIGTSLEILASDGGTDSEGIAVGARRTVFLSYRDPLHTAADTVPVGGLNCVTPVANTDYVFNTKADGSGANCTADMTVTATFFSGSMKYEITNGAADRAYRITLQARGYAIRRLTPLDLESSSTQPYGERTITIATAFQNSPGVGQYMAQYIRSQYEQSQNRPISVAIKPQDSDRLMRHALLREPGDRITLTEPVTAMNCDAIIHAVHLSVQAGGWIDCSWTLAPQSAFMFLGSWRWGMVGSSEWGLSTTWG